MKIMDVHAHIGHWPFRRLPFTDARSLVREMDALEIERAAVCHTHGIFYKNTQSANEELANETRKWRGRLLPVATLNPCYVAAETDLQTCIHRLGMVALRLVPQYHGYDLDDPRAVALARAAGKAGLPVILPRLIVDPRQRHRLDVEEQLGLDALVAFARAIPEARVVGVEYAVGADATTIKALRSTPNLFFEISRVSCLAGRALPQLVEKLGAARFLFGTGMPFKVPEVSLLKLRMMTDGRARARIASGSFTALFRR